MLAETNRDLILDLREALARVNQAGALNGYVKQLDQMGATISGDAVKSFQYINEEYDLNQLEKMLCIILETDYAAPV